MTTSASTNFTESRDTIITRALRITGDIGQGETPTTTQITESSQALNDIVKALITDGLQLWHRTLISVTPIASTANYLIGIGQTTNVQAFTKVFQAYYRVTSSSVDIPLQVITRQEYDMIGSKSQTGTPTQIFYDPPGSTTGEMFGTLTLYPVPDATFAAGNTIKLVGEQPLQDFDSSADNPDFPSYWYNALVWMLAADLAYESHLPLSERSMISKRAEEEHGRALSYDQEEGSIYIQPSWFWGKF